MKAALAQRRSVCDTIGINQRVSSDRMGVLHRELAESTLINGIGRVVLLRIAVGFRARFHPAQTNQAAWSGAQSGGGVSSNDRAIGL